MNADSLLTETLKIQIVDCYNKKNCTHSTTFQKEIVFEHRTVSRLMSTITNVQRITACYCMLT